MVNIQMRKISEVKVREPNFEMSQNLKLKKQ